ncbi:hypothetical protein AKJ16_DCAP12181 [Drosera capensis]
MQIASITFPKGLWKSFCGQDMEMVQ